MTLPVSLDFAMKKLYKISKKPIFKYNVSTYIWKIEIYMENIYIENQKHIKLGN